MNLIRNTGMDHYVVDFARIEWNSRMPGVRDKSCEREGKRLRFVEYTQEMTPHWCSKGHYGIILDGEFELEFRDAVRTFRPGDGVFIPEGEKHRHRGRVLSELVRAVFVEDL